MNINFVIKNLNSLNNAWNIVVNIKKCIHEFNLFIQNFKLGLQ